MFWTLSSHLTLSSHIYFADSRCQERMERSLWGIHSRLGQEEARYLDWRLECRPYSDRCVVWVWAVSVPLTRCIDLTNPKTNWNKTPGYTEAETTAFKNILNPPDDGPKFVDVWRQLHPNDQHYTYFSYRFNCRSKGIGWRLDMCKVLYPMNPSPRIDFFYLQYSCTEWTSRWSSKNGTFHTMKYPLTTNWLPHHKQCEIRSDIYGASDHCPLVMEIEGTL